MRYLTLILLLLIPSIAAALTPIAVTDVVPRQRIEYDTSFNFGVVAFSIKGISNVSFAITSGTATYTGSSPRTVSAMALNTRVASSSPGTERQGVWEYYITIPSSDFSSNGTFTVTPTVTDDDSNTNVLPTVTMYVEGASDESPTEAWVDPWDNDGTGTLDSSSDPFPTIGAAVSAIDTANGDSDYAIIYLAEGTYDDSSEFGTGTITTTNEWLTIKKESSATRENVIIAEDNVIWDGAGYLKFDNVSFSEDGTSGDFALSESGVWLHQCYLYGPTGWVARQARPVNTIAYCTDCYFWQVPVVFNTNLILARGVKAKETTDDFITYDSAGISDRLIVNCEWLTSYGDYDYITASHSDIIQQDNCALDNIIMYNFIGKDLQYQGFYMDQDGATPNTNIAFVNILVEFGIEWTANLQSVLFDNWDHLLIWHNTVGGRYEQEPGNYKMSLAERADLVGTHDFSNVSIIGSVFNELAFSSPDMSISDFASGNSYGNTTNYNHFSSGSTWGENTSTGYGVVDYDTPTNTDDGVFCYPVAESDIIDVLSSSTIGVPDDAYGNERDSNPDLGALEYGATAEVSFDQTGTMNFNQTGTLNFNQ